MATAYGLAGVLCFALMAAAASARQFQVGGSKGWSVPDAAAEPYNAWAGRMRFLIGDQLLFVYPAATDSVLVVDQAAYDACNTTAFLAKFEGGSTVVTLDRSGPFFFISGNGASCVANEKLIVVVLAASHTPPGLSPTPPTMPPTSAAPEPSPSSPPSPAAPEPSPLSPASPPSMAPPSAAPAPSPSSPPSMTPPMPSPMSPPSGAPMPTPESAPSPTGSAPGAAPAAAPGSSPSSSPSTPGSPPSDSPGTPGTPGSPPSDSPGTPGTPGSPPSSDAAQVMAGLISTLAAGIGYAILAI